MPPKANKKKGSQGVPKVPLLFEEPPLDSSIPYPEERRNEETCEVKRVSFTKGSKWILLQFGSIEASPLTKRTQHAKRKKNSRPTPATNSTDETLIRRPRKKDDQVSRVKNFVPLVVQRESAWHSKNLSHTDELFPAVSSTGATCTSPPRDISTPESADFKPLSPQFDHTDSTTPELPFDSDDVTVVCQRTNSAFAEACETSEPLGGSSRDRIRRCLGLTVRGHTTEIGEKAKILAPDTPEHEYGMTIKLRQLRGHKCSRVLAS